MTFIPQARIRLLVDHPASPGGKFVLYWMIAHRRLRWNFSLEQAVGWARELKRPLVVFEPLRVAYPWACDRLHRFVLNGMAETVRALSRRRGVVYLPYVEPHVDAGKGLLQALAADASVVVTDDYPAFMLPRMVAAAARQVRCRFEAVDANGLVPMRAASQAYPTAYAFRRFLQKTLPATLAERPESEPLAALPRLERPDLGAIAARWPSNTTALIEGRASLDELAIDHSVPASPTPGGERAAQAALTSFLDDRLPTYAEARNDVHRDPTSRLSPYLHFGHISSWEVVARVLEREGWLGRTSAHARGAREGWWGVAPPAEAFLDQIVTWRELGFNMCVRRADDYDRYESLPAWAQATLSKHEGDARTYRYSLDQFARGGTHDPLWNAAQGQLRREGRIHNYLRMLWGKKILEWTATPRDALAVMIELNNRYALDGRDPNSYSGIFWTLGRYDRPWAPERPIYGTIRYMSSRNTARKMAVAEYIRRYAGAE